MPETISRQRYRSRVEYLQQHLEMVDLSLVKLYRRTRPLRATGADLLTALSVTSTRYQRLGHPVNHLPRLTNFSRAQNVEHAIISLYGYFTEYLRGILGELFEHDPKLVVGKAPQSLQFHEIVSLGSYDKVTEMMVDQVFRRLENERSTLKLLKKVLDHTGVVLQVRVKDDALAYLELRHLLIHNRGQVDEEFGQKYGRRFQVRVGDKLPRTFAIASEAIAKVTNLVLEVDSQLLRAGMVQPQY